MIKLPYCVKLNVIFVKGATISDMFPYKDKMPYLMNSHVVYHIKCEACSASYIGKACPTLSERFYKHLETSEHSELRDHMRECGIPHRFDINKIKILDRHYNNNILETRESICIKQFKPSLNKNQTSVRLNLF